MRVSASYLNALAARQLANAQQKNFLRAQTIQRSIVARAKSGLVAGVDSALANAEVANAKIALLRALDLQQEEEKRLALLIGNAVDDLLLIAAERGQSIFDFRHLANFGGDFFEHIRSGGQRVQCAERGRLHRIRAHRTE